MRLTRWRRVLLVLGVHWTATTLAACYAAHVTAEEWAWALAGMSVLGNSAVDGLLLFAAWMLVEEER